MNRARRVKATSARRAQRARAKRAKRARKATAPMLVILSHTHTVTLSSLSLQRPPLSLGMCVGRVVIKKLQGFRFRGSVSGSCSPHCDLTSFSPKP
jgi:hypothetical protein